MKKQVLNAILLLLAGLTAQTAVAEEVERKFLVARLASGETASVMLGSDGVEGERAMVFHHDGVIVLGGQLYQLNEVAGLRIETRMVDGIESVGTSTEKESEDRRQGVFDLQGRKVSEQEWLDGHLPKGIYVVHGKKVVVR